MASDKSIILIERILSNTASSAEIEEFNAWVEESEENQQFFQQAKAVWERLDKSKNNIEFDTAIAKERLLSKINKQPTKRRVQKLRFRVSVAAYFLLLLGLTYLAFNFVTSNSHTIVYSTMDNEIKEVVLPDSSHVWLNENSNLQLIRAFDKRQRKVILQGEAYFEVAYNKEKTFKVFTGKTTTKVLGTSFNLKTDESNEVQLIVKSGRVEFYNRFSFNERKVFFADTKGEYLSDNGQIQQMPNENMNYLSWKTGVFTFSNTRIDQVCKTLSSFYEIEIKSTLDDPGLILTGTFQHEDLENILSTIAITLDLEVKRLKSGEIIIQNKNH